MKKVAETHNSIKKKILLTGNGIIGRNEDADYHLSHPSISRKHCEIIIKDGTIRLKDLESKNGTYVNNYRIKEATLVAGDIVRIGELYFQLQQKNNNFTLNLCDDAITAIGRPNISPDGINPRKQDTESNFLGCAEKEEELNVDAKGGTGGIRSDSETKKAKSDQDRETTSTGARSRKDFVQALTATRKKLGCQALFLIELSEPGSVIREESVEGNYILSTTVINYMRERKSAGRVEKTSQFPVLYESGQINDEQAKGIWAPQELKEPSQSLIGAAENSIYCVPLWHNKAKEIVLYGYWSNGCPSPRSIEEIIQYDGKLLALWAVELWAELDKYQSYQQMPGSLSEPLVGESCGFLSVIYQALKLAMTDFSVVLLGPRGCGKTTIAHMIHEMSHRKEYPFKAFNCANFQPGLIESELFGSKRGAYTDAIDRKGYLLEANHGTIFIDSIESCPLEVQAKLRDVLEGRPFSAVGGDKDEKVDVRFLAATNEDPFFLLKQNRLRPDFWDRIGVQFIQIPSLWQRTSDIPELAFHFLEKEKKKCSQPVKLKGFSTGAMKALTSYHWPGNVRELCNVISRLLIYADSEIATEADVKNAIYILNTHHDVDLPMKSILDLPYNDALKMFEFLYAQKKLMEAGNRKAKAAELAKLSRKAFYKLLKRCAVQTPDKQIVLK